MPRHLAAVPGAIWHEMVQKMAQKLSRNRAWDHVVAPDGLELFRRHSATCDECLTRKVHGVQEWVHRVVVASVVGGRRPLVVEFETVKPADGRRKNEGEQTDAYRLLGALRRVHHHQIGGLVADALYCIQVFLQ